VTIVLSENFRALFYAPFYAAEATGAFRDAGVEVRLEPSPDPVAANRALIAGDVDVMWGGPLRVILAHHADPASSLVCFCDVVARDPFFIIGKKPRPDFRPADLAALKLATVSEVPTPWVCLQDDLRRAGVDPARLDRVTDRTMAENEAALGWFATAPAQDIAHLLADYFADVPAALFAQCIDRYRSHRLWASAPEVRREGYDRLHAAMTSAGLLQHRVPFAACVDTSLAREAMARA
jgi:NitT/TauT family transport system substrate-binding protein